MNRLATSSSPYLQQHAENPVDWYPWGDEAFEVARSTDRPILLSVGYAACHWCHVMAHESFEDDATAKLMNEWFVNIKVDREERPDVDAVYMDAVQAMTGQGGWPMTVFMTPDGRPFFAGTYFPKESFANHRGFTDVLHAVADTWETRRADIETQATNLTDHLAARTQQTPTTTDVFANGTWWLDNFNRELHGSHDAQWGGFGGAPKFPPSMAIESLFRSDDDLDLSVAVTTLDAMASGGIYDHIGGGFHRYSVDAFWMVPHFEKMLYDQALLTRAYLHAYQRTQEPRFLQVVEETVSFVFRELSNAAGGFYSAIDADSEGEEGRFYVWRSEELHEVLGEDLAEAIITWYGVTKAGNFEGSNILHRPQRGAVSRPDIIESARQQLLAARDKRVRPLTDDKVITEWNAMFVSVLTEAAVALDRFDWLERAERAGDFLLSSLRREDGRWLRSWHASSGATTLAFAADYAWLVDMFTRLGEATGQAKWRHEAVRVADALLDLFWDADNGGLFTTGNDAEQLVVRQKDVFDAATPSANSEAALALVRLYALTDERRYLDAAVRIIELSSAMVAGHPTAFPALMTAIDLVVHDRTKTVVAGDHLDMVRAVQHAYLPRNVVLWGERDDSALWEGRDNGAYICRGQTCGPVALTAEEVLAQLSTAGRE